MATRDAMKLLQESKKAKRPRFASHAIKIVTLEQAALAEAEKLDKEDEDE
jgi:hypothetical protein